MITTTTTTTLLKKHFGFDSFRPNQEAIINDLLSGKDLLAIMPTGGGKSLCFQLPALMLPGTAIVISPLIALMKDQVDALHANGISAAYYNSGQSLEEQNQVLQDLYNQSLRLLYVAPESLPLLLPRLQECIPSLFAIDEAHCISAWGHDFRPAYTRLGTLKERFPDTPIAAFTATADRATQDDIATQLNIPQAERHLSSFDRKNLYLEVRPGSGRLQQILQFIENRPDESGIIYCLSRKGTETLTAKLRAKGYEAESYHAGMDTDARSRVQDNFVNDRTPIIVATIAFGMGIDKSNVRWVIHYNLPKNIESYYQEIGRSGRDGLPAHTLLFFSYADVVTLRKFVEDAPNREFQLAKLERMQQFAEALSCRRIALLNYFGEHVSENCGHCDNCKTPPRFVNGTVLTQKVCSAVYRLREKEPIGLLIDVLRGARNAQVYDKGYQNLKTYGAAKDIPWLDLQQYIIQMINQGILEIRFHEKGRLLLTPLAKKILFDGRSVQLATLQTKQAPAERSKKTRSKSSDLFDKLRLLRLQLAEEENVPAYIIFSDAALQDMVSRLPKTKSAFMEVSGVGQAKCEKYAEPFLALIRAYKRSKIPTHQRSFDLYQKGRSVAQIAAERELKEDTIYGHLMRMQQEGADIDLSSFLTQTEREAIIKADAVTEREEGALKPLFEHLEGKIPYWKIRLGLYLQTEEAS